jgi:acyl-coenzyme A synthetase/AMP-(fatty) acid ligase
MSLMASDATARTTIPASQRRVTATQVLRGTFAPRVPVSARRPVSIGLVAELAAERHGRVPIYLDEPFAWDPRQRVELDYVEYASLVGQFSAVLKQAGVQRWDRVVVLKSPNYDIQLLAAAAARIGAIPAPLSARLDPDIIAILLKRLQPRLVITDPETAAHTRLDAARLRALDCTAIAPINGGIPVQDLWGGPVPPPAPLKDDEPMIITHTSSTTGVSKLGEACATGVSFSAWVESTVPYGHAPHELFASAISHVHVRAATAQVALLARGTPVLGIGKPTDETIVRLFSRYRPTIAEAHPNNFIGWERLIDEPSDPFASIRVFVSTFDAIHPRTVRRLLNASKRTFPLWIMAYGMTETQVLTIRATTRRAAQRHPVQGARGVGWPVPGVRLKIADPETGRRLPSQHDVGMIQARTPARALSFVGTPEKFSSRRHGNWFDTGDLGRRGRFLQIEVLDRVADHIDGVESCLSIEDVLLDRIGDAEEIVVVPDDRGRPVPVICMRDGKTLDDDTWRAAASGITGLGPPFEVKASDLRRTATAKARRYLLTEMIKKRDSGGPEAIRPEVVLREGA